MPRYLKNYTGFKRGTLTVIERSGEKWLCKCSCGKEALVKRKELRRPNVTCGAGLHKSQKTHGLTGTKLYEVWHAMKVRCKSNIKRVAQWYKDQGITYFAGWEKFVDFKKYVDEHLGSQPDNTSLDRIDGKLGYVPGNIRWATPYQQSVNQRKKYNVKTTSKYIGVSKCSRDKGLWCAYIKVNKKTKNLGRHPTEIEAAIAFNEAAKKYHGTEAKLNDV